MPVARSTTALELLVAATGGSPFMLQLVGAQTWRLRPDALTITLADAAQGVANARRRLGALVHEPALAVCSATDRRFLAAMAKDEGPSRMSELQDRLAVSAADAGQYQLRLIAAELVVPVRRGYVDLARPSPALPA